jgi:hypothetical protein
MGTTPNGIFYPDTSSQVGLVRSHLQQLAETADAAIGGSAWPAYTPTWTTTGTAPSLGNGTWDARSVKIGKTVHFTIALTWGSTTNGGTGGWRITLPYTPRLSRVTFYGEALDTGVSARPAAAVWETATGAFLSIVTQSDTAQAAVTATAPFTWGTGDRLYIGGTYETT